MAHPSLGVVLRRRSKPKWAFFIILLVGFTVAGHFLSRGTVWIDLRAGIYQILSSLGRPTRRPQHTAVVLLDDYDYWSDDAPPQDTRVPEADQTKQPPAQLAGRIPTNRAYLAHLVDQLDAANVAVIALDFDLRSPRPDTSDFKQFVPENDALIAAISRACSHGRRFVLASELVPVPNSDRLTVAANFYDAKLSEPCARTGYIQLPRDIRKVPVAVPLADGKVLQPFALAAFDAIDPTAYQHLIDERETDFPYSQFISETTFRSSSSPPAIFTGRSILSTDPTALALELQDRAVLIGAGWHTLALNQGPVVDLHPSPNGTLSGVLLQANYIEAALQGGLAKPFSETLGEALEVALVLLLSFFCMLEIHWGWKGSAVIASSIFVIAFSYFFLQTFGIFLDFFFPLIGLAIHIGSDLVGDIFKEEKHHPD